MITALLLIGLIQQPSDEIRSLVRDLGEDFIEVRERAQARLIALGEAAIPALREAVNSRDAEVRHRAGLALETIVRPRREREHDERELQALLTKNRIPEAESRPGSAASKGIRFDVKSTPFDDGWIVSIGGANYLDRLTDDGRYTGQCDFDVKSITSVDGQEPVIQRCGRCSPRKYYVKSAARLRTVRITGTQAWFSPYRIEFQDPWDGQQTRVGDFTIQVSGTGLRVTSTRAFPESWIPSMGTSYQGTLKEGLKLVRPESYALV